MMPESVAPSMQSFPLLTPDRLVSEWPVPLDSGAIMLMNKPEGWSSFDAVKFVRSRLRVKKVGHAGTLDPLATGLLICCIGKATKSISQFQEMEKEYRAVIRLGATTDSYDRGTPIIPGGDVGQIGVSDVEKILQEHFSGEIVQIPPIYSAIKVGGERLYKKARRGETAELPPRHVTIYDAEITAFASPDVSMTIRCSKGTYIRSIAHDLGTLLGCGAYLKALERTKIGPYSVTNAWSPDQLKDWLHAQERVSF